MLSLQHLPAEVLTHVCTHLVPSNYTFLLNSRRSGIPVRGLQLDVQASPKTRGTPLLVEDEPTPEPPANIFRAYGINIIDILLLHSKIYPCIVKCLYSSNVFYPPDLPTLFSLRDTWSPLAILSVRNIRVDACGPVTRSVRGYVYFDSWNQLADTDILRIPKLFPGIRELRLGGVGPGVVQRRSFTYRGSNNVRDTEIGDVWTFDNVFLISKIIGHNIEDGPDDVGTVNGETTDHHALSGGRVFCSRPDQSESRSLPQGYHRLHGTRIVRRGEIVKQRCMELEVLDINAVLHRAVEAQAEFKARGHSEVPPVRNVFRSRHE